MNSDQELSRLSVRVGRHLLSRGWVVSTAESCTGGWVAKALTDVAGSSQWFDQGWVTYSNASKRRQLGVSDRLLVRDGAVSDSVVRAMVRGALAESGAQLALAVSGIAGPGGAVPGKPVGTVWLAWGRRVGKRMKFVSQLKHFRGNRDAIRRSAVRAALTGLLKL